MLKAHIHLIMGVCAIHNEVQVFTIVHKNRILRLWLSIN